MSYYECHITMDADAAKIRPLVEQIGWKFSSISGDAVFGDTVKCYATRHFHSRLKTRAVMANLDVAAEYLALSGANVLRRKIELVLFDDKSSKVKLDDEASDQDGDHAGSQDQGAQQ